MDTIAHNKHTPTTKIGIRDPAGNIPIKKIGLINRILFKTPGKEITIKRATSSEEILEAYSLVHRNYTKKGYRDDTEEQERIIRPYDALPETITYIAIDDGKIIGCHSMIPYIKGVGIPTAETFPAEIARLRERGPICEFSNLAIDCQYERGGVSTALMAQCFQEAHEGNYKFIVGEFTPGAHTDLFRINLFRALSEEKIRHGTENDTVIPMALDLENLTQRTREIDALRVQREMDASGRSEEKAKEKVSFLYKFWFKENQWLSERFGGAETSETRALKERWEKEAKTTYHDPRFFREMTGNGLASRCTQEKLTIIKNQWPQEAKQNP